MVKVKERTTKNKKCKEHVKGTEVEECKQSVENVANAGESKRIREIPKIGKRI